LHFVRTNKGFVSPLTFLVSAITVVLAQLRRPLVGSCESLCKELGETPHTLAFDNMFLDVGEQMIKLV
jgi:hypothetical protein